MSKIFKFKTKKNKYKNKKTKGFDSKTESTRYDTLLLLERIGSIKDIKLQPRFKLLDSFKYGQDKISERSVHYTADFQYFDLRKNKIIIEEIKSVYTSKEVAYVIRRKLFKNSIKDKFDEMEFVELII